MGPPPISAQRFAVETGDVSGLSDLTIAEHGYLAVPERRRVLVPIAIDEGAPRVSGAMLPLEGVPEGLDTESIAWLGGNHYAIGTESMQSDRDHDDVLLVDVEGGRATVKRRVPLQYTQWGSYRASRNRGIEALCAAGGALYAAAEETIDEGGARYAPIARLDPTTGAMVAWRLRLTSGKGRISAMTCRARPSDGAAPIIEAFAVERHFGVSRLLRYTLPAGPSAAPIEPTVAADLAQAIAPLPNIEGIALAPDGAPILITDNDYGGVTGPTEIICVVLPNPH